MEDNKMGRSGKIFGITPNVFFLGIVSFFNDVSSEMVKAVMPVFLTTFLGATPAFIGFLDGASDAVASMLRMFSGWLSDRMGKRKKLAVIGYGLSLLTRVFLIIVSGVWQVFTLRIVDRIGKGVREAPRDALISESVEDKEASRSFGFQRALDAFGGVVGPLLALLILPAVHSEYRTFFLIAAILGVLAIGSFHFVKDHVTAPGLRPQNQLKTILSLKHFDSRFRLYLTSVFMFGLGCMPVALVVLRAGELKNVPILYFVYAISSWVFAAFAAKLADSIGRRKTLVLGFIVAVLSYLVLAGSSTMYVMSIGMILLGAYSGLTDGIARAFASKLLANHHLGAGHGLLQAAVGLSSLISGTVGGLVWTMLGSTAAFFGGAGFMALGLVIFLLVDYRAKEEMIRLG
jgi:MFS family permease